MRQVKVGRRSFFMIFQSTHPRGMRPFSFWLLYALFRFQSTHPRGMRLESLKTKDPGDLFQSTHPRGMRQNRVLIPNNNQRFQSTHPRGMRQERSSKTIIINHFNPRIHEGCDMSKSFTGVIVNISIHASTRDATYGFILFRG